MDKFQRTKDLLRDKDLCIIPVFYKYHVSYEPLRIFVNDDAARSTRVQCVLPTTG